MKNLPALTGLRFFVAAAIVLHHLVGRFGVSEHLVHGWLLAQGVSIFFILSGFILTYQHSGMSFERSGMQFLALRAARLYPSHLAVLFLYICLFGFEGQPLSLIANAALLQSWSPNGSFFFAYNAVSWSLATEMAFYVAFPFLLIGLRKSVPLTLLAVGAASFGMVAISNHLSLPGFVYGIDQWTYQGLVMVNPIARLLEFAAGMAAAFAFVRMMALPPIRTTIASVLELSALSALLWNVSIARYTYAAFLPDMGDSGAFWFTTCLMPILPATLLIMLLARGEGVVSRILSLRRVQYLGAISFATYLIHMVVIRIVEGIADGATGLALVVVLTLLASVALHEIVERPAQRFLRRLIVSAPEREDCAPSKRGDLIGG